MDVELLYDRPTVIRHADLSGLVPTVATLVLRDATGTTIQSPAVVLPSVATTVASATTLTIAVANAVGLRVGEPLALVTDGETYCVTPIRIDGSTLHLAAALPVVPDVGSTVSALTMSATVTALGQGKLGAGLQIEWRYENAAAKGYATAEAACVRWLWQQPITAPEVAELLASVYQTTRSEEFCRMVAERVSQKIKNAIEQTGRRPYLYVSPGAFSEVAQVGARWVLADMGIGLVGDLAGLVREYRFAFSDELEKVIAGLKAYDTNNSGESEQGKRSFFSIRMAR